MEGRVSRAACSCSRKGSTSWMACTYSYLLPPTSYLLPTRVHLLVGGSRWKTTLSASVCCRRRRENTACRSMEATTESMETACRKVRNSSYVSSSSSRLTNPNLESALTASAQKFADTAGRGSLRRVGGGASCGTRDARQARLH